MPNNFVSFNAGIIEVFNLKESFKSCKDRQTACNYSGHGTIKSPAPANSSRSNGDILV